MKHITIEVTFQERFTFDFPDDVDVNDNVIDDEIFNLMETLADRTNNYWEDATYEVVDPED